jgi:hypothetical protein
MRNASARWSALSTILTYVERCLEATCRMDDPRSTNAVDYGAPIGERIDAAQRKVSKELNRLTVELLMRDLARKKRKAA